MPNDHSTKALAAALATEVARRKGLIAPEEYDIAARVREADRLCAERLRTPDSCVSEGEIYRAEAFYGPEVLQRPALAFHRDAFALVMAPLVIDGVTSPTSKADVGQAPRTTDDVSSRETEGVVARWRQVPLLRSTSDGPAPSAVPQQAGDRHDVESRVAVSPVSRRRARAVVADLVDRCRHTGRCVVLLAREMGRRRAKRPSTSRVEDLALVNRSVEAALKRRHERLRRGEPLDYVDAMWRYEAGF